MIHERMKKLRLARGYTQEQVAEAMYMEQPTYCKMERGYRKPTAEELEWFCTFMGVTVQSLLDGTAVASLVQRNGHQGNGKAHDGPMPIDEQYYRDLLERKDRQLEESHSLMRSMLDVLKSTLDQLRKRTRGGGGGNPLKINGSIGADLQGYCFRLAPRSTGTPIPPCG
jgi:transcriptional regulator with XRE-family HTH domain